MCAIHCVIRHLSADESNFSLELSCNGSREEVQFIARCNSGDSLCLPLLRVEVPWLTSERMPIRPSQGGPELVRKLRITGFVEVYKVIDKLYRRKQINGNTPSEKFKYTQNSLQFVKRIFKWTCISVTDSETTFENIGNIKGLMKFLWLFTHRLPYWPMVIMCSWQVNMAHDCHYRNWSCLASQNWTC